MISQFTGAALRQRLFQPDTLLEEKEPLIVVEHSQDGLLRLQHGLTEHPSFAPRHGRVLIHFSPLHPGGIAAAFGEINGRLARLKKGQSVWLFLNHVDQLPKATVIDRQFFAHSVGNLAARPNVVLIIAVSSVQVLRLLRIPERLTKQKYRKLRTLGFGAAAAAAFALVFGVQAFDDDDSTPQSPQLAKPKTPPPNLRPVAGTSSTDLAKLDF